jgi:flagella basal body P-ring formation protein FlgA
MRTLSIVLALCATFPAGAATLRPTTILQGPTVLLRDLFDDSGEEANRVLGPGPAPGGRIVVEAPQLRAIARQFNVDWHPSSSADRAVLERPGQPMNRDDVLDAVRAALVTAGASPDCTIALPGFSPPLVPLGSVPRPVVSQLDYGSHDGRFTAMLSVAGEGMEPVNIRIGGQVREMIELPVASTRLPAGAVLGPDDIHMARVSVSSLHGEVVHSIEQARGLQLTHSVLAGQPLAPGDLTRPTMVRRGALVRLRLDSGGLSVTGQGVALEAGATGERIKVLNPGSRTTLEGVVVGPGLVRVTPSSNADSVAVRSGDVFTP